ncbi:MAG: acyl-CoA thioesterase, partial [Alphaproteobacteria bacterium]
MKPFYTPATTTDPNRFTLAVQPHHCVGAPGATFLMGGVQFAAIMSAMETVSDKPVIGATIQFISPGAPQGTADITINPIVNGRTIAQMQGSLLQEGRLVAFVTAALGQRPGIAPHQFAVMPETPTPEACDTRAPELPEDNTLMTLLERRSAFEDFDKGINHIWFRSKNGAPTTAGQLAIMADFLMGTHPKAHASPSLDNTFRVHAL